MDEKQDHTWKEQALRLCERYVSEVVLAFDLCPWAEAALRGGRVVREVCLATAPTSADCLPFLDRLQRETSPVPDVGFLLFPRHGAGAAAFESFGERVRRAERQRQATSPSRPHPPGGGPFLVAVFHPQGAQSFTNPHQLVSFIRRTPDPTLQFVRAELLDRLRETQPDLSESVGRQNHQGLVGAGRVASLDATIRNIAADRDATYAGFSTRPDAT